MRNPTSYMATYMREYRANGRRPVRRHLCAVAILRGCPPRVFVPLAEQRHGHCCFCGLRSYATVCGFCRRELEGAVA